MGNADLKPCPFCGGKAKIRKVEDVWDSYMFVECKTCGAITKKEEYVFEFELFGAMNRAVESWNRRAEKHDS